jgi:MFS family permease
VALTHRNFRQLWIGALTSSIGTWMQKVAQAWLIVTMTGSQSAVFLAWDNFLGEVPLLLLATLGGVLADRRDRRHMILMSQIIQMLAALVLAGLIYTRRLHIAHVLGLSLITGCVRAFGGPAYQSLVPTLVGKEHLANAIALNAIQFSLAQLVGPFIAGATLAAFGMVVCFGLNAMSFLFVISAILALRNVDVPPTATDSVVAQFKGGLQYVQRSPNMASVLAVGFACAFFGTPLFTFLPLITRDVFHRDVGFYTELMTCSGAGALIGALFVAWLGKNKHMGRLLFISLTLFGAIMVGFGLVGGIYLPGLILFIGGSLFVMCTSIATFLAQLLTPQEFHGRVVSLYLVAFLGGSPLAALTSGWIITRVGSAPVMLAINGLVLMVLGLYGLTSHLIARIEAPLWAAEPSV